MRERGSALLVENVPIELRRSVKARAAQEGRTLRDVTIGLLRRYAAGEVEPARPAALNRPPGAARETAAPRVAPDWAF